jgi:hypothetical protein
MCLLGERSNSRKALCAYAVQAIDALIGDINPPAQLMQTQTDRKIAAEQRKTYETQEAAQVQRQQLVRQTWLAGIQHQVVGAEQGVNIAELQANPRPSVPSARRKPRPTAPASRRWARKATRRCSSCKSSANAMCGSSRTSP